MAEPGINASGTLRLGSSPSCTQVTIGAGAALTIDNASTPPAISIGGQPFQREYAYTGSMAGPWAAPLPVAFRIVRSGRMAKIIIDAAATGVVTNATDTITFAPALPEAVWPLSDAVGAAFISLDPSPFAAPFFSTLTVVSASGALTMYSFGGGAFNPGSTVGLIPCVAAAWPTA